MYRQQGRLEDLGRVEPMREAQRRTVERVGDLLHDRVKHHTPVAKAPPGAEAEWLAARKRLPGTLKESWQIGQVEVDLAGERMTIPVFTLDPVAPDVEWPTRPHIITPRQIGKMLRFWLGDGRKVFAWIVHHPGTQGSFMMTTAIAEVAALWQAIGAEEMQRWAREQTALIGV